MKGMAALVTTAEDALRPGRDWFGFLPWRPKRAASTPTKGPQERETGDPSAPEPTIYRFILRHSLASQILLLLFTLVSFPFLSTPHQISFSRHVAFSQMRRARPQRESPTCSPFLTAPQLMGRRWSAATFRTGNHVPTKDSRGFNPTALPFSQSPRPAERWTIFRYRIPRKLAPCRMSSSWTSAAGMARGGCPWRTASAAHTPAACPVAMDTGMTR